MCTHAHVSFWWNSAKFICPRILRGVCSGRRSKKSINTMEVPIENWLYKFYFEKSYSMGGS